jgi:hypothetical protein
MVSQFQGLDTAQATTMSVKVGDRYGLAVIKKEVIIKEGTRHRSGFEVTCACGTSFVRNGSNVRSSIHLGDGLWCSSCAQERRIAKEEGREVPYNDPDGSILGQRYDLAKLKALQDWGYSPR